MLNKYLNVMVVEREDGFEPSNSGFADRPVRPDFGTPAWSYWSELNRHY